MTTEEVLRRARTLLDELGWCQRADWRDAAGQPTGDRQDVSACCARGAIDLSIRQLMAEWTSKSPESTSPFRSELGLAVFIDDARRALRDHLQAPADEGPYCSIVDWNDAPSRTKDEVLTAFDRAIEATHDGKQAGDDGRRE